MAGDLTASPCNNLTSPPPDHSAVIERRNPMEKTRRKSLIEVNSPPHLNEDDTPQIIDSISEYEKARNTQILENQRHLRNMFATMRDPTTSPELNRKTQKKVKQRTGNKDTTLQPSKVSLFLESLSAKQLYDVP